MKLELELEIFDDYVKMLLELFGLCVYCNWFCGAAQICRRRFQVSNLIAYRHDLMHSIDDDAFGECNTRSFNVHVGHCADYLVEFEFNLPMYSLAMHSLLNAAGAI